MTVWWETRILQRKVGHRRYGPLLEQNWVSLAEWQPARGWSLANSWCRAAWWTMGTASPGSIKWNVFLDSRGKNWSVKLVHLPAERDRSSAVCHVKGVCTTDSLRCKREPKCYVVHRHIYGSGILGLLLRKLNCKEEGLRWARRLFHLPFLLLCPKAKIAQSISSTGGGQWVSVLLYEAADGSPLSKSRNYLLKEGSRKKHSHGETRGHHRSLAFWLFS